METEYHFFTPCKKMILGLFLSGIIAFKDVTPIGPSDFSSNTAIGLYIGLVIIF